MRNIKKTAAILMLVSFIFATVSPAMAAGIIKVNDLTASATSDSGVTGASTIYFGSFWQDATVVDGDAGKSAIAWKVLQTDASNTKNASGTSAAGITLLTEKAMYAHYYNPSTYTNWKDSEIRATLNGDGTNAKKSETNPTVANSDGSYGTFAGDAFNDKEFGYILTTANETLPSGGTGTPEKTNDKLFLLSSEEAKDKASGGSMGFKDNNDRKANATAFATNNVAYGNTTGYNGGKSYPAAYWWLRSPGTNSNDARGVRSDGYVGDNSVYYDYRAARSALNLDKQSVIFLSAAAGGKSAVNVGSGFALADYDGADGWKLTLKDADIAKPTNVTVTQAYTGYKTPDDLAADTSAGGTMDLTAGLTYKNYGNVTVAYSGKDTNATHVSAVVATGEGTEDNPYVYENYAKISDQASETAEVVSTANLNPDTEYTMFVYAEQANGNYQTDYASETQAFKINNTATVNEGTLSKGYAEKALTAKLGGDFNLSFENDTYNTGVTVGEGETGCITADVTSGTILPGAVTVKENATLTTANKFTLKGDNTVDGTVTGDALTIADGTTTVGSTGSIENDVTIQTAGTVKAEGKIANATVKEGGTLELNADKYGVTGGVENAALDGGTLTLTGGTADETISEDKFAKLGSDVTGEGTTVIDGYVNAADKKLETAVTVNADKGLYIKADGIKKAVANEGLLLLSDGTLAQNITGSGDTLIRGNVEIGAEISQSNIVVETGSLTTNADIIKGGLINNETVNFTGGTLEDRYVSIDGTTNFKGKTKFSGAVSLANSTVNFYLDGFAKGDTIVETGETIDLADTTVKLTQTEKGYKLAKGETITLITKAGNYNGEEEIEARGATGEELYKYTYGVGIENDALMLSYLDQGVADQTKSFSEARLGASAALNSASDLVAGQAIDSASSSGSWEAFAAMGGSHNRYETGSHIDLNSTNVAAGLSKKVKDNVTLGIFVEGGNGRYTTENEFEDGNVRADGDINYFGGGV
ncbi:MAG: hypothetical protein KBS54_05845, partial [Synergistaceae bacterium]|nr:hypothetical protein [Candidatus Equadaptatus faecalis]